MKRVSFNNKLPISIFLILTLVIFAFPMLASANIFGSFADALLFIPGWLSIVAMQLMGLILYLSGMILNYIIDYTVIDMAKNLKNIGINEVWGVIRDVANMGFIFILLYAAIMTILGQGQDNKKLIVNVVIAAILMNFSIFFTKLVIDAANMLALLFYSAMVPPEAITNGSVSGLGISNSMMEPLNIQTLAKEVGVLDGTKAIIVGVMGSVFILVASFVFLAISIMFIIRFVVLVFVIILSPLAFLAIALPNLAGKYLKQWWDALSGQAFFAPIYFMLTWVVISISRHLYMGDGSLGRVLSKSVNVSGDGKTEAISAATEAGDIGLIVNFFIVIALLIASLVIAKEWANKAGPGVSKLTKWATGAAGNATFGLAGRVGRGTIGAYGSRLADSEELKEMAENKDSKYDRRQQMRARLNLMAGQKLQKQSFDARGTGLGGTLDAGKAQGKGGFAQKLKDDAKAKKEFADSLKPSAIVIDEAEREVNKYKEGTEERKRAQDRLDTLKGVNKDEMEKREKDALKNDPVVKTKKEIEEGEKKLKKQEEEVERETKEKEDEIAKTMIPEMKTQREEALKLFKAQKADELRIAKEEFGQMRDASETRAKEIKSAYRKGDNLDGEFKTIDSAEQRRKNAESNYQRDSRIFGAGKTENEGWNKILYIPKANKQAAAEIKKTKKSVKELVDEALKATGETTEKKTEDDKDETSKEPPKE